MNAFNNVNVQMDSFSSNKFSKLYLCSSLSRNTLLEQIQYTDDFFELLNNIDNNRFYKYKWRIYKY